MRCGLAIVSCIGLAVVACASTDGDNTRSNRAGGGGHAGASTGGMASVGGAAAGFAGGAQNGGAAGAGAAGASGVTGAAGTPTDGGGADATDANSDGPELADGVCLDDVVQTLTVMPKTSIAIGAIAGDDTHVYWRQEGACLPPLCSVRESAIYRLPRCGGDIEVVIPDAGYVPHELGRPLEVHRGQIYWEEALTPQGGFQLVRAPKEGGAKEELAWTSAVPTMGLTDSHVYWVVRSDGETRLDQIRIDDPTETTTLVTSHISHVDTNSNGVYVVFWNDVWLFSGTEVTQYLGVLGGDRRARGIAADNLVWYELDLLVNRLGWTHLDSGADSWVDLDQSGAVWWVENLESGETFWITWDDLWVKEPGLEPRVLAHSADSRQNWSFRPYQDRVFFTVGSTGSKHMELRSVSWR